MLYAFLLAVGLGGGNAIAIRFTVAELPPFWGAALRFGGAAVLLWVVAAFRKSPLPPVRLLPDLAVFGFLNFGAAWAFIYWGLRSVEPGMAQVMMALTPLLTFFFAILQGQEAFQWRGLVGGLVALAGIAFVFLEHPGGDAAVLPMLSIVAGAACIGESIILLKRLPRLDPGMINAVGMSMGAASLLIVSRVFGESWRAPTLSLTWFSVLYLVVIGTVIFFSLMTYVIRRWSASASAYGLVIMPLETVTLSAWLTGEKLNAGLLVGGALVLLGVWVGAFANRGLLDKPAPSPAAAGEAD